MSLSRLNNWQVQETDTNTTGIITSIPETGFSAQRVAQIQERTAYVLFEEGVELYRFTGISGFQGNLCLMGPSLTLTPLPAVIESARGEWPAHVLSIVHQIRKAIERGIVLPSDPSLIYVDADDRLVVLSPELCAALSNSSSQSVAPEWEGGAVLLAVETAYRVITGRVPDTQRTAEPVPPVHARRPEFASEGAALIEGVINGTHSRTLSDLALIDELIRDPARRIETEDGLDERRALAETRYAVQLKRHRRRSHFRKYLIRYAVGAALAVLTIMSTVSLVRRALAPPPTAGLTPLAVVQGYYHAWNGVDEETMTAYTLRGVGKERLREAINIFVVGRVRQAYENKIVFVQPDEWVAAGRPDDIMPYGITDLQITAQDAGESTASFEVTYRFWNTIVEDEQHRVVVSSHDEIVQLVREKGAWIISAFLNESP